MHSNHFVSCGRLRHVLCQSSCVESVESAGPSDMSDVKALSLPVNPLLSDNDHSPPGSKLTHSGARRGLKTRLTMHCLNVLHFMSGATASCGQPQACPDRPP